MTPHSPSPDQSSPNPSDALIDAIIAGGVEERERRARAIEEARLAQPDKEPFDAAALAPFYKLDLDPEGNVAMDASALQDLQYAYYVGNPDLQSLQAFGEHLTWLDQNEAN